MRRAARYSVLTAALVWAAAPALAHHSYGATYETKKEIKLQTAEGEKNFPLVELGLKTKDLPNGTLVTVEVNEAGVVIDLHQVDIGTGKR